LLDADTSILIAFALVWKARTFDPVAVHARCTHRSASDAGERAGD